MRDAESVRRWYYFVLGAILICGIVYMYLHRRELGLVGPSTGTDSSSNTSNLDQIGTPDRPPHIVWTTVNRDKDGFDLEMPADSKEIQIPAYNESGGTEQVQMMYSYPDAETSFSVAWADEPPVERVSGNSAEKTLDTARVDALARTQSVLISETRRNLQGYPARDFVGRNGGGGIFNARLILAGRRLYMLIAAFPSASARRDDDVAHFFDSFHLTARNQ
jgi:hypothetical protein